MTYKTEFPDFPDSDMPTMPEGFEDTSWHNDACPSMESNSLQWRIWADYIDVSQREFSQGHRFIILSLEDDSGEPLLETDDWNEVLAHIARERAIQDAGIHVIEDHSPRGPMFHVMRGDHRIGIAYCRSDIDQIRERALNPAPKKEA